LYQLVLFFFFFGGGAPYFFIWAKTEFYNPTNRHFYQFDANSQAPAIEISEIIGTHILVFTGPSQQFIGAKLTIFNYFLQHSQLAAYHNEDKV